MRLKGYILAALSAALYGTNPAFAVPLYKLGMNAISVLVFRYLLCLPLLAIAITWAGEGFGLKRNEIIPVISLGIIMAISSLTMYESYNYMHPGVASTLLFMYPILTALIMTFFFHERFRFMTGVSLAIMSVGLYLLMINSSGVTLNFTGVILVVISSLSYAVYLVFVKVSKTAKLVPTLKSLFYQLLSGGAVFATIASVLEHLATPSGTIAWLDTLGIALLPTVISLLCTMKAIKFIGPTPTAIFGALEPVTAVILSMIVLGEAISLREAIGGTLIIVATLVEVASGNEGKG